VLVVFNELDEVVAVAESINKSFLIILDLFVAIVSSSKSIIFKNNRKKYTKFGYYFNNKKIIKYLVVLDCFVSK
jgi:hypothetical protein